jgi:hypothetical protein
VKREQIAVHEAGHAVIGHALGWIVGEIALSETTDGAQGHTVAGPAPGAGEPAPEDTLLYACAGIVAEALFLGTPPRDAVRQIIIQGARDGEEVVRCLSALGVPDWKNDARRLDDAADSVASRLSSSWSDVEDVAVALLKHGVCQLRPS